MVGILVEIAVSWLLLLLIEKKSILALGFRPPSRRVKQFLIGCVVSGLLCVLIQYFEAHLSSAEWALNDSISTRKVLNSFWWDVKSVLTEELAFRGALLYILIQRIGASKSVLLSAIAFGVYHWFSYGVLGNVMAMIFVFLGTGLMGYAWALAFAKTKSILLPFGLHLGWNVIHNTLFSKGPLGDVILLSQGGIELTDWMSLLNFVSGLVIAPILVLLYVRYFVKEEPELVLKAE